MPDRNNHWITPRANGWADKREGAKRATRIYPTQEQAYNAAREKALKEGGEVFIQNRESRIRARNTYGRNDPRSSRG